LSLLPPQHEPPTPQTGLPVAQWRAPPRSSQIKDRRLVVVIVVLVVVLVVVLDVDVVVLGVDVVADVVVSTGGYQYLFI
jgi:hypothetical protein